MTDIKHPLEYTNGVRTILLASRLKDGADKIIRITSVSSSSNQFVSILNDMRKNKRESDRIYASLSQRDILKAARSFKHKLIEADYDQNPEDFYKNINNHWVSSLMINTSTLKSDKLWMFDCDSQEEYMTICQELLTLSVPIHYQYSTKNGVHVIVKPFNRQLLSENSLKSLSDNSLMLWSY